MDQYVNKTVTVVTQDGRVIVGMMKGYDQYTNLILDECHERVFSTDLGVQSVVLGLYIVRGDNIAVIGEVDTELDGQIDLSEVLAPPIPAVVY
mmetsp:Transcript_6479/g.16599  ORF Transcript_6479/g.16599 Transcript_6479/m.16599 type:complete len:93 (-) Transcript_6479:492-770(-)